MWFSILIRLKLRDGPLDITGGGGGKEFSVQEFFYGLLVCRNFISGTQALHVFFFRLPIHFFFLQHI